MYVNRILNLIISFSELQQNMKKNEKNQFMVIEILDRLCKKRIQII